MANKKGIGYSPLSDKIYLGKQNPTTRMWIGEKEDVTENFWDVAFQFFKEKEVRSVDMEDGSTHMFFHIKNDKESIERAIKYLSKQLEP